MLTINDIRLSGSKEITQYDYAQLKDAGKTIGPNFYRAEWHLMPAVLDDDNESFSFYVFKYDLDNNKWDIVGHHSWEVLVSKLTWHKTYMHNREFTLATMLQVLNNPGVAPSLNY